MNAPTFAMSRHTVAKMQLIELAADVIQWGSERDSINRGEIADKDGERAERLEQSIAAAQSDMARKLLDLTGMTFSQIERAMGQ